MQHKSQQATTFAKYPTRNPAPRIFPSFSPIATLQWPCFVFVIIVYIVWYGMVLTMGRFSHTNIRSYNGMEVPTYLDTSLPSLSRRFHAVQSVQSV